MIRESPSRQEAYLGAATAEEALTGTPEKEGADKKAGNETDGNAKRQRHTITRRFWLSLHRKLPVRDTLMPSTLTGNALYADVPEGFWPNRSENPV